MKKKFISLLFLPFGLIPLTSLGQISSGTTLLGGTLNYNSYNIRFNNDRNQAFKSNSFAVAPKAGYFVSENLVLGLGLGLNTGRYKNGSTVVNKQLGYSIGPFMRFYKFLGERTALFGNAAFNYTENNTDAVHSNLELSSLNRIKNIGAYITPGLTYFASSKIGIEISLGYISYTKITTESGIDTPIYSKTKKSEFGKYYGLANSFIGVNFYLGRS